MIKNNYQIKRKALKSTLADFLYNYLILKRQAVAIMYREEYLKYPSLVVGHWEDKQMPNTYVHYADIAMETLLVDMLPEVEKIVGKPIKPSYSYCRVYKCGDELLPHKDRPECEISTTLFLGGDEWEIYMEGKPVLLKKGDMCVYRGCDLEHWRIPFEGKRCVQVFLHYVLADTKTDEFDGREVLGLPFEFSAGGTL
tara:strand:+ start:3105 stop:3695 length:591 start_codon:yes stop_codon:yes gene_type:complete